MHRWLGQPAMQQRVDRIRLAAFGRIAFEKARRQKGKKPLQKVDIVAIRWSPVRDITKSILYILLLTGQRM
jgi:hypothetical protein